ncbi:glycosyltransferase [Elioraea rosea]|uniref:glycosyltransferase n=1 Tax=Elioraea rosea TaxID=2492390 RepID=UPI001EF4EFE9|nr:glycosyltransferase [Elioraea rosea]
MRFTGLAAHEAIPGHVGAFDIEYMAAGRAIITPDQPNLREVLRDGETALLFDRTEEGAMWPAVLRLLEDRACGGGSSWRREGRS